MKKTLLAAAVVGLFASSSATAATVVGFKVGGDYWNADTTGTFKSDSVDGSTGPKQTYDYGSSSQGSLWIAIEHPIPIVPNIKIRENRLEAKGYQADSDSNFNGINFVGDTKAYNDVSNTDFVLYYEILDNDIVSVDLGAAYKKMHGALEINGLPRDGDVAVSTRREIDSGVVMLYANGEVGIPGLGLYAFADLLHGIDETGVHDYSAGLGWKFDGTALDTKIRVGYRDFTFDVDGFSGLTQDTQFKGAFAGVELVF